MFETPELQQLELLWECHYPILRVQTLEEAQLLEVLQAFCNRRNIPLFCWSSADGLHRDEGNPKSEYNTSSLDGALRHLDQSLQNGIFVFFDPHPYLGDPVTLRLLREVAQENLNTNRMLVLVAPMLEFPMELGPLFADFELPKISAEEVKHLLNEEASLWRRENGTLPQADQAVLALMVRYLTGAGRDFSRRIIRQAIRNDGKITYDDLQLVLQHKRATLGDTLLDFSFSQNRIEDVGGLDNLKSWLALRQKPFLQPAPEKGVECPQGLLLLGVQGCGKSLAAKAVAGSWGVPLLRLDFGSLYNKFFGESERNLRSALAAAESMAPCVLWVDEIEKGLASDSGGGSDGGVSRRILGTLLTWLAERKTQVFMVATANDITTLPPELMRKGRFDEIFFVDLPDAKCRQAIFRLHLKKRQQDVELFDLESLAQQAEGFSGAEIEACIRQAILEAYGDGEDKKPDQARLLDSISRTRPLSLLRAEEIASLRVWASERTVFA